MLLKQDLFDAKPWTRMTGPGSVPSLSSLEPANCVP